MRPRPKGMVVSLILALLLASGSRVDAQVLYRGELNNDGQIDSGDVLTLLRALSDPAGTDPLVRYLADTNADTVLDQSDLVYESNVLLGKARPKTLIDQYTDKPVSFVFSPNVPEAREEDTTSLGWASFYYPPEPIIEPRESDGVPLGAPSFYFEPPPVEIGDETNATELGSPSFLFVPAPTPRDVDAVQLGTPSFDRR